jgi:hypothetical protein
MIAKQQGKCSLSANIATLSSLSFLLLVICVVIFRDID